MARTLNYIILLSIAVFIVAASGCSSNNANSTQVPVTSTPETKVTPIETQSAVETQNVTEKANVSVTEGGNIEENENITIPEVENGTYVAPHEPRSEAYPITNTTYNNSRDNIPVVPNKGTLKIIPSRTNASQSNTTR
jgi:hypothetical protein